MYLHIHKYGKWEHVKGKALALTNGNITVVYSLMHDDLKREACMYLSREHSLQLAFAAAFWKLLLLFPA